LRAHHGPGNSATIDRALSAAARPGNRLLVSPAAEALCKPGGRRDARSMTSTGSDNAGSDAGRARRARTSSRTRTASLIVACALFMQNLDSTVLSTALPNMATAFGADPVHMSVALTSYMLSLAVFIPASGWVADRYGARQVFRAAIVVFTVGSVLCGRADSLWFLVLSRVIQGIGGAMMVPVGRLVLLRTIPKNEMVAAMSWLSVPAMIGPVIGPPLGGFIVTYANWRWIFDINVPIGVLGVVLVTLFIDESKDPDPMPFDGWGLLWSGLCLATVMMGVETIGKHLVPESWTVGIILFGVAAGVIYMQHAKRLARPLLDFRLLRIPTFAISCGAGSMFRLGVGALPFLMPMMLQLDFGYTASQSGLTTFATAAGALGMKPVATSILRRFGFRDTLLWNGALAALSLGICAAFRPEWPVWVLYVVLLVGGVFRSLQFTSFNTVVYADVSRPMMSAATSMYSTIQQLSMTVGITIGAASLEAARAFSGHVEPGLDDFSFAFLVVGVLALASSPMALFITRDAGAEMTGHRVSALDAPQEAHAD
jgi:EmrB/QacA subfamily drug resistance transporter